MKLRNLILFAAAVAFAACANTNEKSCEKTCASQCETKTEAYSIDSVLSNADALVGQSLTIEGVCTHACSHGATKIFLMGSDDTKVIRVQAGEFRAFDTKCVNSVVSVNGTLQEQRIDEAYLQAWEARVAAQTDEHHGEGEGGCSTEKAARGEKGNTVESRIADFRTKIAEREAKSGKAYLSFYFFEAENYKIAE